MRTWPGLLPLLLVTVVGTHAALAQAAFTERVPGVRIEYPDTWTVGPALQEAVELVYVAPNAAVEARVLVNVERRVDAEDAVSRAAQFLAQSGASTDFFISNGWPAARQRAQLPLPKRYGMPDVPAVRLTAVFVVGSDLYLLSGWILESGSAEAKSDATRLTERLVFAQPGDAPTSERVLARLKQRVQAAQPEPGSSLRTPKPASQSTAAPRDGPGVATTVNQSWGEVSVAVSIFGQNIVVGTQNAAFSSQAGSQFTQARFQGASTPSNGDPSVAWAPSGSFYMASLRIVPNGCSIQVGRSDDQGRVFNWDGSSPRFCAEPAASPAARCFPDQEHIASSLGFGSPQSSDPLYVVWRHFGNMGAAVACANTTGGQLTPMLACSNDGGGTWSIPTLISSNGDYARVAEDASSVWVAFMEGPNVMVDRFLVGCGPNGLVRVKGFPRIVATLASHNCAQAPLPGLDRCHAGLVAPTVASDATRVAVTYGTSGAGSDEIQTVESYDGGFTWTAPLVVHAGVAGRRFMPWSCNVSSGPDSRVYMGWYDRRAAPAATLDLTDYYVTWLGRGLYTATGELGPDIRLSAAPDPQCRAPWTTLGTQGAQNFQGCPAVPLGTGTLGGTCTGPGCPAPAGCPCVALPAMVTPTGCTSACTGRGIPRYGDYNGLGCSPQLVAAAWASTVDIKGAPNAGNQVLVNTATIGLGLRNPLGTSHSGNFIQRVTSSRSPPEFDLFVSSGPPYSQIRHLVRANHLPGLPWEEQDSLMLLVNERSLEEQPLGVSVIQSRYPQSSRPARLEVVARILDPAGRVSGPRAPLPAIRGQYLAHYSQSSPVAFLEKGPLLVDGRRLEATGDPALIQSTRGDNGNFELLVPQGDEVVHYMRDNDLPNQPWSRVATVLKVKVPRSEKPIDVALIQSNIRGASTNVGDLEAIVRIRDSRTGVDYLRQFSFDATRNTWWSVGVVREGSSAVPVSGKPAFIQSTLGNGRFELLVPNGRNVVHYTNDKRGGAWTRRGSLYSPTANPTGPVGFVRPTSLGVALFQGTFGSPGNLEAVVWRKSPTTGKSFVDAWYFSEGWHLIGRVAVAGQEIARIDGF